MAVLFMILRKMSKNKWLELSVLGGLLLAVALTSSIPMYTDAILQRTLLQDLEHVQTTTGKYPGTYYANVQMGATSYWDSGDYKPEERPQVVKSIDAFMANEASPGFGIPTRLLVRESATDMYTLVPADRTTIETRTQRRAKLAARSGLLEHIRLVDGRLPAAQPVNGVYETLVTADALKDLNMVLGNTFQIDDGERKTSIKLMPVGVIGKKDDADPYWYGYFESYGSTFFLDEGLYEREFLTGTAMPATSANWLLVLDYSRMDLQTVHRFVQTSDRIDTYLFNRFKTYNVDVPALDMVKSYFQREAQLRKMLWSLYVPVMLMLAFYLYMVSNLIVEQQKNEIAVLRSRGASRLQVLLGYAVEGLALSTLAFLAGPLIGLLLTKVLGAANGFLTFVDRTALPVRLSVTSFRYALYTVGCSLIMTLIPVLAATRSSIIHHKQQSARRLRSSFWHRYFVDVVLLGASVYGLRMFDRQQGDWLRLGVDASGLSVDPLLFLVPALFILGLGLLLLRLYPFVIRLLYWVGKSRWPASLYSTLIQVGRSGTQYQFVMLFLILTIATGLYSASAARTLNQNTEDKIRYKNGADLVLKLDWISDAPGVSRGGPPGAVPSAQGGAGSDGGAGSGAVSVSGARAGASSASDSVSQSRRVQYLEPRFQPIAELPGVQQATRVFVKEGAGLSAGKERSRIELMGIHTAEFGRTAWLRDGLLDYHLNEYLNLIAPDPKAVLISRSIADRGIGPGDTIAIDWDGVDAKPFTVYGVIDYWPGFNPNPVPSEDDGKKETPMLVVGHLDYIQMALGLEPYEVWLKLLPDADRQEIYDELAAKSTKLVSITDTREELMASSNDPFQLAINGVMTLGFLISAMVCLFGFLLYWVLSISGRTLQFGILRAMGMSFSRLLGMLTAEQLLTSGAAVLLGGAVGSVTSTLFVRLFQLSFNPATQVPPFRVTFDPNDSLQLYVVVTVMLATGLLLLGWRVSRIHIHQAVKLGED